MNGVQRHGRRLPRNLPGQQAEPRLHPRIRAARINRDGGINCDAARRFDVSVPLGNRLYRNLATIQWVSGVSTYGTKLVIWVTDDFWLIVTPRRMKMSQKSSAPPMRVPPPPRPPWPRCPGMG